MMGEPAHLIRSSSMEFESTDDEYADAVSRLSEAAAIEGAVGYAVLILSMIRARVARFPLISCIVNIEGILLL